MIALVAESHLRLPAGRDVTTQRRLGGGGPGGVLVGVVRDVHTGPAGVRAL